MKYNLVTHVMRGSDPVILPLLLFAVSPRPIFSNFIELNFTDPPPPSSYAISQCMIKYTKINHIQ